MDFEHAFSMTCCTIFGKATLLLLWSMHSRPEEMVQKHKLLDLFNLFEIYPQSMFADLFVSLHILVSHNTTWTQTDPHPLTP